MKKYLPFIFAGAGIALIVFSSKAKASTLNAPGVVTGTTSTVPGVVGNPFAVGRTAPQIPADYTGNTWGDPNSNNYWVKNKNGNWIQA